MPFALAATATDELQSFDVSWWLWAAFLAGTVAMLLVDLLVLNRNAHEISLREAAVTSSVWISIGVGFSLVIWANLGGTAANQYLAGFIIEKSLSVDNVFVWAVIFNYFAIPLRYQHRVLFWGIFGAIALRAIFVFAGVALIETFTWVLYLFGAILVYTAFKVAFGGSHEIHPENNPALRLVRRIMPVSSSYDGQKMFTHRDGVRMATPLFVVLVLIEASDVIFAVDSVPAILAISRDQFVVLSSNILAILGLRALYFLLAGVKDRLVHLDKGLGAILLFVGVKMLISEQYHIPTLVSLGIIAVVLATTVIASILTTREPTEELTA